MWDLTGKLVRTFKTGAVTAGLYHLGLSLDGKRVVCNDTPTTTKVWEIEGDNPPVTLGGHTSQPLYAAYSPDGKLLATGSDQELLLWDAEKLKLVKKFDTPAGWLAFAPDGKTILTAQHHTARPLEKDVVTRWDLATYAGKPLPPLTGRTGWPVYHLSPDGKRLYSHVCDGPDAEGRIRVYDAATGADVEPLSLQALAKRFPALLRGADKAADSAERLGFAQIAYDQKKFAFAARLWSEALAKDPNLADDPLAQHRYHAACAAALAAAGQGKDEPPLADAAKAKLRAQALGWLKAELSDWSKVQPPRLFVARKLWHWQQDSILAGIRDQAALAKLPPEERKAFTEFWADVAKSAEPAGSTERLEFARVAALLPGQGKNEPPFDAAAKAKLRQQALDWLKAELSGTRHRAGKAQIIATTAPLPGLLEKLAESAPKDGQFQAELSRHYAERHNVLLAVAARTKARAWFEGRLAEERGNAALAGELADLLLADPTRWTVLKPAAMKSEGGATLTTLKDNSVLVSGPNPEKDVFTLTFRDPPARIQQLRLEVLPHESLPNHGPGRHPTGEFVLSTVKAQLDLPKNAGKPRLLKLAKAWADNSTGADSEVWFAIDESDGTGWKTEAGKPHFAVFEFAEPVTETVGTALRVTLEFKWGQQNGLGRFRLSVSPDPLNTEREQKHLAAPKLTDPWLKLATAYGLNGRNDKATEYFAKALEANPKLGDDRQAQHRYHAACAAALAAAGQGLDEPPQGDAAKAKLRGQALDWLKAEMKAWHKLFASGSLQGRQFIAPTMRHWQQHSDLAGIRDAAALAKLPTAEQKAFGQLWADVAALLKKATP
jgi:tetratricopeptide (TPR) repeat protein